jgi:hypothetical protein
MNATILSKPTEAETIKANRASKAARKLVTEFASQVSDAREWPNRDNVETTRIHLLAYIAQLEGQR